MAIDSMNTTSHGAVVFEGTLRFDEYRAARLLHARGVLPLWLPSTVFLVFAFAVSLLSYYLDSDPWPSLLLFLVGLFFAGTLLLENWQARRGWRGQKLLREPVRGTVSEAGVTAQASHGHQDLAWTQLHAWKASETLLLIYQGPGLFHPIPRRFFASPQDWQRACELARAHLPSRFTKQKRLFYWLAAGVALLFLILLANLLRP